MNENQSKPEENLPGNEQPQITVAPPTPASTTQPHQPMEVHHHAHVHEKKKWKEYIFQFLMLFLAIILGFQAENFRERISEKHIEEEYIKSLLTDLENDTTAIGATTAALTDQVNGIDTIQTLFTYDLNRDDSTIFNCYYYTTYLQISYPINFNERTVTQLLSSGTMRLLKTSNTADRVTEYFSTIRTAQLQKQMYLDNINKCTEAMFNVYDIAYLRQKVSNKGTISFVNADWSKIKFLTTDPVELKKLSSRMEITKLITQGYKLYLNHIKIMATNLIEFLREEYHIKENKE